VFSVPIFIKKPVTAVTIRPTNGHKPRYQQRFQPVVTGGYHGIHQTPKRPPARPLTDWSPRGDLGDHGDHDDRQKAGKYSLFAGFLKFDCCVIKSLIGYWVSVNIPKKLLNISEINRKNS
jgi:hypothetical protein